MPEGQRTKMVTSTKGSLRFYGGVFLVTLATLMLQVVETRILSAVTWYHLAFFVISVGMFGLTAGAVWVYLRRDRFTQATLSHDLAYFSAAFAIATAVSLVIQMGLPLHGGGLLNWLAWPALLACLSIPFFFSGVVVSLALTRSPYPVGRVYGVDLAGAALGCLGVLAVLNMTDAPSAVLWISATAAAAALLFVRSGIGRAPKSPPPLAFLPRRCGLVTLALVLIAAGNGLSEHRLRPLFVKGVSELGNNRPIFDRWNSYSRVTVTDDGVTAPKMWGPAPEFRADDWRVGQRMVLIDGDAGTAAYRFSGDVREADFLRYDITNLPYHLPGLDSAAIIGVGGGRDILSARVFGVSEVTGVEINPIMIRLLTKDPEYMDFAGLADLRGVTYHVDEARSWFARSGKTFDIIQMSLIDTWAATGAGAFTLSENGLYTVEGWRIFLRRLTPDGLFTVSRWYSPDRIEETGRMVSLAMAAAFDMGLPEPSRHIFLASTGTIATLVFSRSPLSPERIAVLKDVVADMGYGVLIAPDAEPASRVLREIVASANPTQLDRYTSSLDLDLTPPTDNRPFFFNQLRLSEAVRIFAATGARTPRQNGVAAGNLTATLTLVKLFVLSIALVVAAIVLPLRPAIKDVGRKLAVGGSAYFFLIGVGFMCAEIGLLQRMGVFLGHPIYSLSIVLFSLILATGIGSMISDRWPLDDWRKLLLWSVLTGGYLFALPLWLPDVLSGLESASLLVRASLCVLLIAPAGLLMGYGFPTGMRLISAVDGKPAPWFWGINGAAGVLASSLAVACSIAYGIDITLIVAASCYVLLIPAAVSIGFRRTLLRAYEPA